MYKHSQILKNTFQEIAELAFEILEVFNEEDTKIKQVHEDGVSSIILKKIARLKKKGLFVKAKSLEIFEKTSGADFDIWIGENDSRYIRLIVQAKSFGNKTSIDDSYSIDLVQCEKLIAHSAKKHESFPLYFLYQYIDDVNLRRNHFSFLEDFKQEYSSITFTSAYNIRELSKNKELKFSDIHRNELKSNWKNNIYEIFENSDDKIGLPLYLLYDISPSSVEKFQKLISPKNNSLGFFLLLLLLLGENFPFKIHKITAKEIEERYGRNRLESEVQFKNLIIINDDFKSFRDNQKLLEELIE